jgi:molybdenum cofactor cytidylyltransferase
MQGSVPKQLLPYGESTLAAVPVRNAEASLLDRVVVVVGHRAEEVAAAVSGGRAEVVENPDYRLGNMTSFRAGAVAAPGCDAYVILLADMPRVTTPMIDRVVETWLSSRPWAAVSRYSDGLAHPLLLSAEAMAQAVEAEGTKGVWRFLHAASSGSVHHVDFDMPMPEDINTLDDYRRVNRRTF